MDIYVYKSKLEHNTRLGQDNTLLPPENAWRVFLASLLEDSIENEKCEELGFGVGLHHFVSGEYFQIYFGRLIDADEDQKWRTAEINFYYYYKITQELRNWLEKNPNCDTETAFCLTETKDTIRKKKNTIIDFVEEKRTVWEMLRGLDYSKESQFQFWLI